MRLVIEVEVIPAYEIETPEIQEAIINYIRTEILVPNCYHGDGQGEFYMETAATVKNLDPIS